MPQVRQTGLANDFQPKKSASLGAVSAFFNDCDNCWKAHDGIPAGFAVFEGFTVFKAFACIFSGPSSG